MRPLAIACLCATFLIVPTHAWAGDKEQAEALFSAGRALLDSGDLDAACTNLQRSLDLRYGIATEFHLADCEERRRHFVSATLHFQNVAKVAEGKHDTVRAKAATARALAADAKTSHVTVSGVPMTGERVVFDGAVLEVPLSAPKAVDPGTHTLRATAPGFHPYEVALVAVSGADLSISLPALEADAPPALPVAAPVAAPVILERHRPSIVPWVMASGFAAIGTGGAVAYYINRDRAVDACSTAKRAGALCANDSALSSQRTMALGGIVVGSAALATLVVVTFVQAGREETTKVGCAPSLGGFGCGVSGTF